MLTQNYQRGLGRTMQRVFILDLLHAFAFHQFLIIPSQSDYIERKRYLALEEALTDIGEDLRSIASAQGLHEDEARTIRRLSEALSPIYKQGQLVFWNTVRSCEYVCPLGNGGMHIIIDSKRADAFLRQLERKYGDFRIRWGNMAKFRVQNAH